MNIRNEIDKLVSDPELSSEEIAESVLKRCSKRDFVPILMREIEDARRRHVRRIEIEVLSAPRAELNGRARAVHLEDLAEILDQPYRIGDGNGARLFRMMTREEHVARLTMLRGLIAGAERSLRAHEQAIELIDRHGVSCLDELDRRAIAA